MGKTLLNQFIRQVVGRATGYGLGIVLAWLVRHELLDGALGIQIQSFLPELIGMAAAVLIDSFLVVRAKEMLSRWHFQRENIALRLPADSSPEEVTRRQERERAITGTP